MSTERISVARTAVDPLGFAVLLLPSPERPIPGRSCDVYVAPLEAGGDTSCFARRGYQIWLRVLNVHGPLPPAFVSRATLGAPVVRIQCVNGRDPADDRGNRLGFAEFSGCTPARPPRQTRAAT